MRLIFYLENGKEDLSYIGANVILGDIDLFFNIHYIVTSRVFAFGGALNHHS
ncbi:MAG TPA: hypothetical protein PKI55_06260 [Chitinophagaceae bacterium]|nr:hypothetical protein [Chitinophagaceae bacterium]